ncbi:DUF2958 domain-containing protein [Sphingomonas lycopersici]|uniref:DUF2958 domain-containing protein n=1 Tax=Sphingomonas lycopersici TaxID=2951807 RepID=UPI003D7A6E0B
MRELEEIRLPFGLGIERELLWEGKFPLSVYAEAARRAGSIVLAEQLLHRAASSLKGAR